MSSLRDVVGPFLRGVWVVAKREAWANTKSVRLVAITAILALAILASAFGLSGLTGGGPTIAEQNLLWVHPAFPTGNATDRAAVVFVSDSFGNPRGGVPAVLGQIDPLSGQRTELNRTTTDAAGGAVFPGLTQRYYAVWIEVGRVPIVGAVEFPPATFNLSVEWKRSDLARAGYDGDVFFHATDGLGRRIGGAVLTVNGTEVARTDANGFVHARLIPGRYLVNVTHGADRAEFDVVVRESPSVVPVLAGPNSLLAFLALGIMGLMAPIFAIAMSYDSIAKERFTGSMDLLLIRPVSRAGIAVGKFLGTWTAVAIPTVVVALGGAAAVASTSGRGADAGFVGAFLLGSLFLIAVYILLMQIFSTLARTPGSAILAGFLVWIVFEILWSVVFLVLSAALGIQGGTEAYFVAQSVTNLTNPGGVYGIVIGSALPADVTFGQGSAFGLPPWAGAVAGVVWIAVLLPVAVWAFVKRAPR